MFLLVFDFHFFEINLAEALGFSAIEVGFYMLAFYYNFSVAIPLFLTKKKRGQYLLALLVGWTIYTFLIKITGMEWWLYENENWRSLMSISINFGLSWLISTLFWYYKKEQKERELHIQMKADKLEAEMKFLKNQISPHFIFNTLNNIYSLVQQGHPNASPMLAKLSGILRYLLYDSAKKEVPLKKELQTIEQYIELQLMRKPKSQNVDFYQEGNTNGIKIVPLLLLNFVENCFKHGDLDKSEEGFVKIACIAEEGQRVRFTAENSKTTAVVVSQSGGLGNLNIQRQLDLNYKDKYQLVVKDEKEVFGVELVLEL